MDWIKLAEHFENVEELIKPSKRILKVIFVKLRHKIHIEKMNIKIYFALKNVVNLGMIYGIIWGVYYSTYAFFTHYFRMNEPTLDLETSSKEDKIAFEVECIITTRLTHIIRAALHFGFVYFEIKRIIKNRKRRQKAQTEG